MKRTYYVFSPTGILGNNYCRGNVKPYGSIWKVIRTYYGASHGFAFSDTIVDCVVANAEATFEDTLAKYTRYASRLYNDFEDLPEVAGRGK